MLVYGRAGETSLGTEATERQCPRLFACRAKEGCVMAQPYEGVSNNQNKPGILGRNTADGVGVVGESDGLDGVWGDSHAQGGSGVSGRNSHPNGGNGVFGTSDPGRGVVGQ